MAEVATVAIAGETTVKAKVPAQEVDVVSGGPDHAKSTTTTEQDRHSLGQRRVNIIWEGTQASIALIVTLALIYVTVNGIDAQRLGDAFTLIVALYFVRTNHTKIGGVALRGQYSEDHR